MTKLAHMVSLNIRIDLAPARWNRQQTIHIPVYGQPKLSNGSDSPYTSNERLNDDGVLDIILFCRHWVFATEDGTWVTQREEPRMALITISIHGDWVHFDAPGMTTLKLSKNPKKEQYTIKKVQ